LFSQKVTAAKAATSVQVLQFASAKSQLALASNLTLVASKVKTSVPLAFSVTVKTWFHQLNALAKLSMVLKNQAPAGNQITAQLVNVSTVSHLAMMIKFVLWSNAKPVKRQLLKKASVVNLVKRSINAAKLVTLLMLSILLGILVVKPASVPRTKTVVTLVSFHVNHNSVKHH